MRYCITCVTPDTRPHIDFDSKGMCGACRMVKEKKTVIDWEQRAQELERIFQKFRKETDGIYDCIVPVSGGKDSIYQVHIVKNTYKMNPLCMTFRSIARTPRGEENLQALRNMGVDHIDIAPNPIGVNKLTKKAFFEFGDCSLLDHLAIYSIIPNFAVRLGIPLVIWGENPWMEYGGNASEVEISKLNREFLKNHNILKGRTIEDWVKDDLSLRELQTMIYPSEEALNKLQYTPIFIGYFLPWDSRKNMEIAIKYGFRVREKGPIMGLYDFSDLDCMNIVIHHYFKWLKFGFNRVTDNASNEIRKGRMTREDAIKFISEKDGIKPPKEYIEAFCRQINITEKEFWDVAEKFRNKNVWYKNSNEEWCIRGWVGGDNVPDRFSHTVL